MVLRVVQVIIVLGIQFSILYLCKGIFKILCLTESYFFITTTTQTTKEYKNLHQPIEKVVFHIFLFRWGLINIINFYFNLIFVTAILCFLHSQIVELYCPLVVVRKLLEFYLFDPIEFCDLNEISYAVLYK